MSHALTRLRELFSDPLLVRVGRQMALTSRAEAITPQVTAIVHDLAGLFGETAPAFDPGDERSRLPDRRHRVRGARPHAAAQRGARAGRTEARAPPVLALDGRAVDALRSGEIDLAIGVFPQECPPPTCAARPLLDDRFAGSRA